RQSTMVDNTTNLYTSAIIALKLTVSGSVSPTANSLMYVYLLRGDSSLTVADDAAGSTDAGITINNAPLLGSILCTATTTGASYYGVFDTKFLGSLGPKFG